MDEPEKRGIIGPSKGADGRPLRAVNSGHELHLLTRGGPGWHEARFLLLSGELAPRENKKNIVIVCGQALVKPSGEGVSRVGYDTGEA